MNGFVPPPGEEGVRKTARNRTRIILAAMILWGASIAIQLVHLQIFHHDEAKDQVVFQSQVEVKIFPDRGMIRDRKGTILAQMVSMYTIASFNSPQKKEPLEKRIASVNKLAPLLGLDENKAASIRTALKQEKKFVFIKRKIDFETAAHIEAMNLPGIIVQEEPRRSYPQGSLAAHVLGHVNIDNEGKSGVEYRFDEALQGKPGKAIIFRDTYKRPYRSEQTFAPERGRDVVLTIDSVIQYFAQREIEKAVAEHNAGWGAVIVSDPATGEILAMADAPSVDPNQYSASDPGARFEWALRYQIDPGSTFKIVTASAALESRKVATYETFDCSAKSIDVAGGPIRDHKPYGVLSFSQIIAESSNIGTIQIGRRVGAELLYKTIMDFGFGKPTGIELPAEASGIVHPVDKWTRRSLDSISVGYEVSVTPIQLLQAINIIANRGVRVAPHIIKSVDGRPWQPADDASPAQVISAQTAEKLIDILERVVLEGTGKAAAVKGYSVAGKTGTSQIYDPVDRKFSLSRHTASFIGFVPTNKPVLSIAVVLYEPKNSAYYGGQVAAPVFREVALHALRYLHVFPSATEGPILASAAPREAER